MTAIDRFAGRERLKKFVSSASILCVKLGHLEEEFHALEAAGLEELHFDITDGEFAPNFTLGADFIKLAKSCVRTHCNVHLMTLKPERHIQRFVDAGADSISVHVEACTHPHRVLSQIRDAGASPGIAINPATPLTKLDYLLPLADRVLLMAVDPGCTGQKIVKSCAERCKILHDIIVYNEYSTRIEVEGNINVSNAAKLAHAGAEIFVLDTSSIFTPDRGDLGEALVKFTSAVRTEMQVA